MKKKLVVLLLCSTMVFAAACGKKVEEKKTTEKKTEQTTEKKDKTEKKEETKKTDDTEQSNTQQEPEENNASGENEDKTAVNAASISDMESYLIGKGVIAGNTTPVEYGLIGAVNGAKYQGDGVEVYEFDVNSELYKQIVSENKITIEGMDSYEITPAAINGKFILVCTGDTDYTEVITAFQQFTGK